MYSTLSPKGEAHCSYGSGTDGTEDATDIWDLRASACDFADPTVGGHGEFIQGQVQGFLGI